MTHFTMDNISIQLIQACPICGEKSGESLTEHLKSHSKQALINVLLAQHQRMQTQHPAISTQSRGLEDAHRSSQLNQILLEFQSTQLVDEDECDEQNFNIRSKIDPSASNSSANQPSKSVRRQPSSVLHIEFENNDQTETTRFKEMKPNTASLQLTKSESRSSTSEVQSSSSTKPTFVLVDHSSSKPGPSKRRNSDESGQHTDAPQEEADSWILEDGRTIPVYSSLLQIPAVCDSTPACTINDNASNRVNKKKETFPTTLCGKTSPSQMHLDLMTDEEIPPRGEISEYEESNASSILSDDSNLRANHGAGIFVDRKSSTLASQEQSIILNRKKKSIKPQLYICQECPQVQVFGSLFEAAEHKFEVHQNRSKSGSTAVSTNTNFPIPPNTEHILPEKIRHQSQNDSTRRIAISQDLTTETNTQIPKDSSSSTKKSSRKEYFCVYCNFTSAGKASIAQHMDTSHADQPRNPNMFECNHCGKVFRARTNLRKHLLIHRERKYSCPICSKGFTSNFKLTEHTRVHTKNYPYKCSICEKAYRTLSLLNHHTKMHHLPEGERPPKRKLEFYCSICHRILHSKRSYMNHLQLHKEKPIKCSFCSETFTRHSVLVRHIRVTHDPHYESKESKDCPVCNKKLHPNSMIKHMRIHSNEKPYSCNVCGKSYRTYANLTSHSWSHTNLEKPHKCRQCPKSYLFKKNLENHMMVHKRRSMHFTCNECGVKFSHKVNMKRHLEEHFKEKTHVCKICNKAFQRHYYLIEHERIHTGVKPFQCTICGKASTTKSNHRAHLKIHDARETGNQEG